MTKPPTRRVCLRIRVDAADRLLKFAGSERKQGEYVSDLIMGAPPPTPPGMTAAQAQWFIDHGAAWLRYLEQHNKTG